MLKGDGDDERDLDFAIERDIKQYPVLRYSSSDVLNHLRLVNACGVHSFFMAQHCSGG